MDYGHMMNTAGGELTPVGTNLMKENGEIMEDMVWELKYRKMDFVILVTGNVTANMELVF